MTPPDQQVNDKAIREYWREWYRSTRPKHHKLVDSHFTRAGELAAKGIVMEYRRPKPASENNELTAALRSMRKAAAHNYISKKDVTDAS